MHETTSGPEQAGRALLPVLWLFWLAGLVVNSLLAWKVASRGLDGPLQLPGCTAGGFDCESVLTSPYSQVLGYSLTTWAFAYYGAVLVILLLERRVRPFAALLLPVVATPAVVGAVWFSYVMHSRLEEYCPWCLADHGINLAFFVVAIVHARSVWRQSQAERIAAGTPPLTTRPVHLAVNAGILLGAWAGTVLVFMHASTALTVVSQNDAARAADRWSFAATGVTLQTVAGDPESSRRVTQFSCPTCSHCRRVHEMLEEIGHDLPLRIEMRFAPLDPSCNPTWSQEEEVSEAHRQACALTEVALAVAAADESAFAEFADWLYTHQAGMTVEAARAEAEMRVGAEEFEQALQSQAVAERLEADIALAQELQIAAVPRLFVPGGALTGAILRENLEATLRRVFDGRLAGTPP